MRVEYARVSRRNQELETQRDALATDCCKRVFDEKTISREADRKALREAFDCYSRLSPNPGAPGDGGAGGHNARSTSEIGSSARSMPAEDRTSVPGMPIASRSFALDSTWLVVAAPRWSGPEARRAVREFGARQEALDRLVPAQ